MELERACSSCSNIIIHESRTSCRRPRQNNATDPYGKTVFPTTAAGRKKKNNNGNRDQNRISDSRRLLCAHRNNNITLSVNIKVHWCLSDFSYFFFFSRVYASRALNTLETSDHSKYDQRGPSLSNSVMILILNIVRILKISKNHHRSTSRRTQSSKDRLVFVDNILYDVLKFNIKQSKSGHNIQFLHSLI